MGYDFFKITETVFKDKTKDSDIINIDKIVSNKEKKLKEDFLNFVTENRIPIFQIIQNKEEYKFGIEPKEIEKISEKEFKITHSKVVITYKDTSDLNV